MARALMWLTLFPPCKVFCRVGVKGLLMGPEFLPASPPYDVRRGGDRAAPATADRDDRGGQLDARPRGGSAPDRHQGGRGASRGRVLRLSLRGPERRARSPGDLRDEHRGDDPAAPLASR